MSDPALPAPTPEADTILADVQARAMQVITTCSLVAGPGVFILSELSNWFHPDTSWLFIVGRYDLLVGPVLQFLLRHRLTLRQQTWLYLTWLGIICTAAFLHIGALMGSGIGWAMLALSATFFLGRRLGAGVLAGFASLAILQLVLVHQGWLTPPHDLQLPDDQAARVATLVRINVSAFLVLLLCYGLFALIHETLKQALIRMAEAQQLHGTAEAARVRAEETMQANQHFEALGQLASGVAHDVNNALTSVLGHAELLRYSLPAGEEQTYTEDIIAAARSAAQTTRQLLSLNRRTLCQPVSLAPGPVVETVGRLVQRLVPESIQIVVEGHSPRLILVDPADLQQALLNLLLNSRDALPRGGTITLRITDQPAAAPGERPTVRLEVADTGIGIAPEILPRIFEPFFTTKPVGRGTGLGLAMVRRFMDEAGGQINVASTPGAGTTVALVLPESPLPADDPGPLDADEARPGNGQRILVVEDQPELCALIQRVLTRGGYAVRTEPSTTAALAALEGTEAYDLLCTDGIIGTTPAHTLIGRFREKRPDAPVLVCSGHLDDELVRHGIALREISLLRKPFTGTELLARVRLVLQSAGRGPA